MRSLGAQLGLDIQVTKALEGGGKLLVVREGLGSEGRPEADAKLGCAAGFQHPVDYAVVAEVVDGQG